MSTLSIPQPAAAGKIRYSPNPEINATIDLLLAYSWAPIPVAPAQPADLYPAKDKHGAILRLPDGQPKPLFTGKNPSYLSPTGPRLVSHGKYVDRLPTPRELSTWFADPATGIGTCGGAWLDIDANKFPSAAALEAAVAPLLEVAEWVERTQSGGFRIAIAMATDPGFKNFGMAGIRHVGEIFRSNSRDFVILAPTVGAKGRYQALRRGSPLPIADLADWGITPSASASASPSPLGEAPLSGASPKPIPPAPGPNVLPFAKPQPQGASLGPSLLELISKKNRQVTEGNTTGFPSPSDAIVSLARDVYGWENFASAQGVSLSDSADQVIASAAAALGRGDKLARMLAPINRQGCQPALPAPKRLARLMGGSSPSPSPSPALGPASASSGPVAEDGGDIVIGTADSPGTVALERLYADGYCTIDGALYEWVGTHYRCCNEGTEKYKINRLLARCVKVAKDGSISRPWCSGAKVMDTYTYVLTGVREVQAADKKQDKHSNSPTVEKWGINCTNGFLAVDLVDGQAVFSLHPHSPDRFVITAPHVEYIPGADSFYCDALLQALDPEYIEPVLRTFATAINLPMIWKVRGRTHSLVLTGGGANGKDAIGAALGKILGRDSLTTCTLGDFASYDQGRKFNLAPLVNSRINWASENDGRLNIGDINSLKAVITGQELICEKKFKEGFKFDPNFVSIFSTNSPTINLVGKNEAIKTRFSIVKFNKTFVDNPTAPNELKADPRFVYDAEWVEANVLPALLNRLIAAYKSVITEGIDYSPFDPAMEANAAAAYHLLQFADDTGLIRGSKTDYIAVEDLWTKLRIWYENEDYLSVTERGDNWADDPRPGDPLVRFSVKLKQRLEAVFNGVTSGKITNGVNKGKRGIFGLRWADSPPPPVAPTAAPATAPAPPAAPAPAPTDGHGLWLTPGADPATAEVEVALLAAETPADLELIKASYNGSLTAVMAQWRQDRRYDLLLSKVAILKGGGHG